MTAINLALRNLYGYVLWGNSLTGEVKLGYRTGMNSHGGVIRHVHPGELAAEFGISHGGESLADADPTPNVTLAATGRDVPARQLHLF